MKSILKSTKIVISAIVIVILLTAIITSVIAKSTVADRKVKQKLELGEKYLSEFKYEEAIIAFKEVIEIEPRNVDAYLGIADAYVALEEPEEAISWLEKGIAEIEADTEADIEVDGGEYIDGCEQLYIKTSRIYKETGDVKKAEDVLEQGYRFTKLDVILAEIENIIGQEPDADYIISGKSYNDISMNDELGDNINSNTDNKESIEVISDDISPDKNSENEAASVTSDTTNNPSASTDQVSMTDQNNENLAFYYINYEKQGDNSSKFYIDVLNNKGTIIWTRNWEKSYDEMTENGHYSDIAVDKGVMYFAFDGIMYAINVYTGEIIWTTDAFANVGPFIDNNRIYYTNFYSNDLYCLDMASGNKIWSSEPSDNDCTWAYDIFKKDDNICVSYDFNQKTIAFNEQGDIVGETEVYTGNNYQSWDSASASSTLLPLVKYKADNINDFDNKTAWVEGVDGYGEGEWISLEDSEVHTIHTIYLVNGYHKSYDLLKKNSYLKKFKLEFNNGNNLIYYCGEIGDVDYYNSTIKINLISPVRSDNIKLTILDVYPGRKYEDTCISDIMTD